MELIVLTSLKWELSVAGPYDFLDQLLFHLSGLTDEERATLRRHAAIFIVMCSVGKKCSSSWIIICYFFLIYIYVSVKIFQVSHGQLVAHHVTCDD